MALTPDYTQVHFSTQDLDLDLKILVHRLQLLKSQRELAAIKCHQFAMSLEASLSVDSSSDFTCSTTGGGGCHVSSTSHLSSGGAAEPMPTANRTRSAVESSEAACYQHLRSDFSSDNAPTSPDSACELLPHAFGKSTSVPTLETRREEWPCRLPAPLGTPTQKLRTKRAPLQKEELFSEMLEEISGDPTTGKAPCSDGRKDDWQSSEDDECWRDAVPNGKAAEKGGQAAQPLTRVDRDRARLVENDSSFRHRIVSCPSLDALGQQLSSPLRLTRMGSRKEDKTSTFMMSPLGPTKGRASWRGSPAEELTYEAVMRTSTRFPMPGGEVAPGGRGHVAGSSLDLWGFQEPHHNGHGTRLKPARQMSCPAHQAKNATCTNSYRRSGPRRRRQHSFGGKEAFGSPKFDGRRSMWSSPEFSGLFPSPMNF